MDHSPLTAAAFKAYDVRGVVPEQLNQDTVRALGTLTAISVSSRVASPAITSFGHFTLAATL